MRSPKAEAVERGINVFATRALAGGQMTRGSWSPRARRAARPMTVDERIVDAIRRQDVEGHNRALADLRAAEATSGAQTKTVAQPPSPAVRQTGNLPAHGAEGTPAASTHGARLTGPNVPAWLDVVATRKRLEGLDVGERRIAKLTIFERLDNEGRPIKEITRIMDLLNSK